MNAEHQIRPLAGDDRAELLALLDRCSVDSLYERFLTHSPMAGPRHVDSLFADPRCYTAVTGLPKPIGFGSLFFADHGVAEVLARNHRITTLFRRCTPMIEFDHPDGGVVTATIGVTAAYELAAA